MRRRRARRWNESGLLRERRERSCRHTRHPDRLQHAALVGSGWRWLQWRFRRGRRQSLDLLICRVRAAPTWPCRRCSRSSVGLGAQRGLTAVSRVALLELGSVRELRLKLPQPGLFSSLSLSIRTLSSVQFIDHIAHSCISQACLLAAEQLRRTTAVSMP